MIPSSCMSFVNHNCVSSCDLRSCSYQYQNHNLTSSHDLKDVAATNNMGQGRRIKTKAPFVSHKIFSECCSVYGKSLWMEKCGHFGKNAISSGNDVYLYVTIYDVVELIGMFRFCLVMPILLLIIAIICFLCFFLLFIS